MLVPGPIQTGMPFVVTENKRDDQSSVLSAPERPIRSQEEDELSRGPFVRRLSDALINPDTKRSNGVVLGITGQWGSGKSSILNLLFNFIDHHYPDALIVRFDPWLVSGCDDLISQFFSELLGTINESPRLKDRLADIAGKLCTYGETVVPLVELVAPGFLAKIFGAGFQVAQKTLARDRSLHAQRADLLTALNDVDVPIVVFIDELDRVEDDEIKAVAQLVRSVMDFPNISYVLAYDAERVIQALGSGTNDAEIEERGRSYLEKIVQFQIPLPIILDQEITQLINAALRPLQSGIQIPENWQNIERYKEILDILVPDVISTPRDVKRLIGTYHVVRSAVGVEADWIDLIGLSALMIKAPKFIERLKRNPQAIVEDPITQKGYSKRFDKKITNEERLKEFAPQNESGEGVRALLQHLFPAFAEHQFADRPSADSVCMRRPLLTALRFGLLPGVISREKMDDIVREQPSDLAITLREFHENDRLDSFLERLEETYRDLPSINHELFWQGVSLFLRKDDNRWMSSYSVMFEVVRAFSELFLSRDRTSNSFQTLRERIFNNLVASDDVELIAHILRAHIHEYGIFGFKKSPSTSKTMFLAPDIVEKFARELSEGYREKHLQQNWLRNLWSLQPVFTMKDTEIWDDACRVRMDELMSDNAALDCFALMFFAPGYSTERTTVEKLVNLESFMTRVSERLVDKTINEAHETVQISLRRVIEELGR